MCPFQDMLSLLYLQIEFPLQTLNLLEEKTIEEEIDISEDKDDAFPLPQQLLTGTLPLSCRMQQTGDTGWLTVAFTGALLHIP